MTNRQLDEEAIFHIARKIPDPEAQGKYLDQICAGDQPLRDRVDALLKVHAHERQFLQTVPQSAPTAPLCTDAEEAGREIGRYKLRERLGEGGFGIVWAAEQSTPVHRKVALKIIKPGMDTREIVARFEAERQALALMDHPNIARVFDGGTTPQGRPYFVMELIRGVPVTEHCDANRLTIAERLKLFIDVCKAVQHAHQKGIIHRDIKPSNVLVTLHDNQPVPKVIDFGVAKALSQQLTDKTIYTRVHTAVGTLAYMAPEQAALTNQDIDTRADIYGLGALLYELLTGTTPLDSERLERAALDEAIRIVREEEPPRASTKLSSLGVTATTVSAKRKTDPAALQKIMRGELDWILLKALDKDRTRRYETASAFAEDLDHYLHDEPVKACPPSALYALRKLARKHRILLRTAGLVGMALVLGLVVTACLAFRLDRKADELAANLYIETMVAAGNAYYENNYVAAQELHAGYDGSPLRQFEWSWLKQALSPRGFQKDISVPYGVGSMCFSPTGDRIAFGLRDGTVYVCNLTSGTGKPYGSAGPSWTFTPVIFLDDNHVVYGKTCDKSHEIRRVDLPTGAEDCLGQHPAEISGLANGGEFIVSGCLEGRVRLWKLGNDQPLVDLDLGVGATATLSQDGRYFAAGDSEGIIRVWESNGASQPLVEIRGHGPVSTLCFSPSSEMLASGVGQLLKIWRWREEVEIFTESYSDQVLSVEFSSDGHRLLTTARDGAVMFFRVDLQERGNLFTRIASLRRQSFGAYGALSSDGKLAIIGGFDQHSTLWNLPEVERDAGLTIPDRWISDAYFLPGTEQIVVAHHSGATLQHHDSPPTDATVAVWHQRTGQQVRMLVEHSGVSVAVSCRGCIAVGTREGVLLCDSRRDFEVTKPQELEGYSSPLAFSADGSVLVAGSSSGQLCVWSLDDQTAENHKIEFTEISALAFSNRDNHRLAVGTRDGTIAIVDLARSLTEWKGKQHWSRVMSVCFSPDDQWLASGSWDSSISLWDLTAPDSDCHTLDGHNMWISRLLFSPDGRTLFSASGDRTIKVWDVPTRQLRFTFRDHEGALHALDMLRDGDTIVKLVSGGRDGHVRFWATDD